MDNTHGYKDLQNRLSPDQRPDAGNRQKLPGSFKTASSSWAGFSSLEEKTVIS
ncbi:hypothetical protein [Tellurirhabdus rosea]|uniref:hypothetical protein n=1 Tax=Tellurirhabdus rosea TaxID=2674997 RepID=UPI00225321FD|nr:hypothetical protein [Tellurirhabdus rosea]